MLVILHIIDQFIWGNKITQLGVGPQPIARPKLTVGNMSAALHDMLSPAMRQNATNLGSSIRAKPDGVTAAVHLIEECIERKDAV